MRCRDVASHLVDRDLERLPAAGRRDLEQHLASCPSCAARAAAQSRLTQALLALRRSPGPAVDVAARVAARLPLLGPREWAEVPARSLGWAAAAACVGALAVAGSLAALLPPPAELGREAFALRVALLHAAAAVAHPLQVGVSLAMRLGGSLLQALPVLARWARPAATVAAGAGFLVTVATIATIVARDLASRRPPPEGVPR